MTDLGWLEYSRALVLQGRGDLDGAARVLEELARSADLARARRLVEEACSEGEGHMCAWLRAHPDGAGHPE